MINDVVLKIVFKIDGDEWSFITTIPQGIGPNLYLKLFPEVESFARECLPRIQAVMGTSRFEMIFQSRRTSSSYPAMGVYMQSLGDPLGDWKLEKVDEVIELTDSSGSLDKTYDTDTRGLLIAFSKSVTGILLANT